MKKLLALAAFAMLGTGTIHAILLTAPTGILLEDFDGLLSSGSEAWSDGSTLSGWYAENGGGTNAGSVSPTIMAGSGTDNTGSLYSFGSSSSTDRALGSVGSNPQAILHGGCSFKMQPVRGSHSDH